MNKQEIIAELYKNGVLPTREIVEKIDAGASIEDFIEKPKIDIVKNSTKIVNDITVNHFVNHFRVRLDAMTQLLRNRSELTNLTNISRVQSKEQNEEVSLIGYVYEIRETKNGHMMLTLEDKTGTVQGLVVKRDDQKELFDLAKNLVPDDIIGINGGVSGKDGGRRAIVFINEIILPDVPRSHPLKKCPDDVNAIFIGDLHVGAKLFLKEEFEAFIAWLNDPTNAEAKKVQYIFIVGDLVEGIGIYPGQENDLETLDIYEQYKISAEYLKRIPKRISIILCPGNHDTVRLTEPQPPIPKDYAEELLELPNLINVSSPSVVNIHKTDTFPGFDVLLYHGNSFFYYINNVESIRKVGGFENPDAIMEFLLKRRHLAPTFGSTQTVPDPDENELFIEEIPDFFITGHLHKSVVSNYRNVTMMSCSCFVDVTDYQLKQGMVPDLARVAVVNLRTREVKMIDFAAEKNAQRQREADELEV